MGYITDVLVGFSTSSGVCPFPSGTFQDGRDICDWSAQFTFTTNPALIANADLTGFRGQITDECMTTAQKTAFFARIRADGGDLRMTISDGSTEIPTYVHYIDTASERIWFSWRLSGVLPGDSSTVFKVYVGNAVATAYPAGHALGRNAVFPGFNFFFDFAQSPGGGAPQLTDLTGNGNNGTANNGPVSANGPQGMRAWDFELSSSQYAALTDNNIDGEGQQTFSCWFNSEDISAVQGITSVVGNGTNTDFLVVGMISSKIYATAEIDTASSKQSSVLSSNTWYRLTVAKGTGGISFIRINAVGDTNAATTFWGQPTSDRIAGTDIGTDRYLDGKITAAAWRSGTISTDLDDTEYNNESDPNSFIPCTSVFFN